MAIRSRHVSSTSTTAELPPFLSAAAWPGVKSWSLSVVCSIGIFGILASLAWHGAAGGLPDLTTLLVAIPAGGFSMILIAAALWTLLAAVPFEAGLAFIARILPLSWAVPLLELARTSGAGFVVSASPFGRVGYFFALFTGALLPVNSSVPAGMRVGILITALAAAFVVWFARKNILRSVIAYVVMNIGFVKLLFFSTGLASWSWLLRGADWSGDSADAAREAIRAVTNGYWWTNLYERFPSAIEQQADIAIRLTSTGLIAFSLGGLLVILFFWRVPRAWRLFVHAFRAWSAFDLALYVMGAGIVTAFVTRMPSMAGSWWFAFSLGVIALAAFRLHAVLERCLHHYADGQSDPRDPLACGDVTPASAQDVSLVALAYALLASLALGWPILVAVLGSLAASWLSRDRLWKSWPWSATAFRAIGASMLALAGFFFMSQQARLTKTALLVMILAAGYRVGMEVFWKRKKKDLPRMSES